MSEIVDKILAADIKPDLPTHKLNTLEMRAELYHVYGYKMCDVVDIPAHRVLADTLHMHRTGEPLPSYDRTNGRKLFDFENVQPLAKLPNSHELKRMYKALYRNKTNKEIDEILAEARATLDHVIPKSQGGPIGWHNVQLLCWKCNQEKADTPPETPEEEPVKKKQMKKLRKLQQRVAKDRDELRDEITDLESQFDALNEASDDIQNAIELLEGAADALSQYQ